MAKLITKKGREVELIITANHGTSMAQSGLIRYRGVNVACYQEGVSPIVGDPDLAGKNQADLTADELEWSKANAIGRALIRADREIDKSGFAA